MPKDEQVKIEVELSAWLLRRVAKDSYLRSTLESHVGQEVIDRGLKAAKTK